MPSLFNVLALCAIILCAQSFVHAEEVKDISAPAMAPTIRHLRSEDESTQNTPTPATQAANIIYPRAYGMDDIMADSDDVNVSTGDDDIFDDDNDNNNGGNDGAADNQGADADNDANEQEIDSPQDGNDNE